MHIILYMYDRSIVLRRYAPNVSFASNRVRSKAFYLNIIIYFLCFPNAWPRKTDENKPPDLIITI